MYKPHVINAQFQDQSPDLPEFFQRKRHVFIMTNAGRPIYVQYGNEIKSSIFLATLNAIMQKFLLFFFEDKDKQNLFKIQHHDTSIYILQRNCICYICSTNVVNDSELLIYQMLDHLNTQLISIVTDNVNLQLMNKPNYDLGYQLGGSRNLLTLAVKNGYTSPCIAFNSFAPLPMTQALRQYIHNVLRDIKNTSIVCTLMLTETVIIDICRQKNVEFKISDMLVIQGMLQGQAQLRKSENWIPICLPGLSAQGFVYAYINFFHQNIGIVMISDDSSMDMFTFCKEAANDVIEKFKSNNLVAALTLCLQSNPVIPKCLENPTTIKHFITKHISGQIFVPSYHVFGKNSPIFKKHLHNYAELYKEFLISTQSGNNEGKQNYFQWGSDGYGITQYHEVLIMFCFDSLVDISQMTTNVHALQRMFKTEELVNFFILKPS